MIRAVFKNGVLQPLDPPPSEWLDGRELVIEEASAFDDGEAFAEPEPTAEELEAWRRDVNALVAQIDPGDPARIRAALDEADKQAKAQTRREMGLE